MRETQKRQENNKRRRKSTIRRQSMTCKDISCSKAKDDKQEQENMEIDLYVDQNEKKYKKTKKPATEYAQLDLRSVQHENVQLKKQIHESHHKFVEKSSKLEKQLKSLEQLSGNHVPKAAQVVFHDVYNLLSKTSAQFLQGSSFLSDAVHLISSLLTQSNGPMTFQNTNTHETPHVNMFNSVSPYMDPVANVVCTTPPPDEPSAMEITASQSVLIETNDTTIKPLDRDPDFDMEQDVKSDTMSIDISVSEAAGRGSKRKSCTGISFAEPGLRSKLHIGDRFTDTTLYGEELLKNTQKNSPFHMEQENVSSDTMSIDISVSEAAGRRSKRKLSCTGVNYAEPGLRSKLRRGDRFTEATLYGEELLKNTRKKKKSLTQSKRSASLPEMGNAKKRAPLINLTNIINEER